MLQNVAGCFDTSDCVEGRLFRPSLSVKHVANWTGIPTDWKDAVKSHAISIYTSNPCNCEDVDSK